MVEQGERGTKEWEGKGKEYRGPNAHLLLQISRVVEGAEPAAFKQYFRDWRDASILPTAMNHVFSASRLTGTDTS